MPTWHTAYAYMTVYIRVSMNKLLILLLFFKLVFALKQPVLFYFTFGLATFFRILLCNVYHTSIALICRMSVTSGATRANFRAKSYVLQSCIASIGQ